MGVDSMRKEEGWVGDSIRLLLGEIAGLVPAGALGDKIQAFALRNLVHFGESFAHSHRRTVA
jgi:hypothetical protein